MDTINIKEFIEGVMEAAKNKFSPEPQQTEFQQFESFKGFQVPIKSEFHNSGGFDSTGKGKVGRVHQGLDLRAPGGTSIYPIAPGIVTVVQPDPKGGNTLNIKHSGSVTSYYAHLGTINVHKGDKVGYNTVLGTVGASGNAKGFPHLHLQIWKNGQLVAPESVISVPEYTVYNNATEKLWLPGAQEQSQAWNMNEHLASKGRFASRRADKLLSLATQYYKLTQRY